MGFQALFGRSPGLLGPKWQDQQGLEAQRGGVGEFSISRAQQQGRDKLVPTFDGGAQHPKLPHLRDDLAMKHCKEGSEKKLVPGTELQLAGDPHTPAPQAPAVHLHCDWPAGCGA